VASDELNAIDLAMLRETPETVGAAQKTDGTDSDVSVRVASADAAPKPDAAAARNTEAPSDDSRDNSWMDRLWSAVGDGFVALFAMLR